MIRRNKKIMAMFLCTILFSTMVASTSVQAKSNVEQGKLNTVQAKLNNQNIEITEDFARSQLLKMGFLEKEADKLIKEFPVTKENMDRDPDNNFKNGLNIMSRSLSSPGDKDHKTYTLTEKQIRAMGFGLRFGGTITGYGLSKSQWGEIIIRTIGWKGVVIAGVVMTAAGYCAYMYFDGYKGVRFDVTYTYMYGDNSMEYFWGVTSIDPQRFK